MDGLGIAEIFITLSLGTGSGRDQRKINDNVINLRPNSLFCRKISSIHHHLKESEMNSVPAVPTTDQAVLPKII